MLAVDEFSQQCFAFGVQTFVIFEQELDGPFESFEIVSVDSRRNVIARALGVHAMRLHDPTEKSDGIYCAVG